jgi:hypothetical protein
MVASLARSLTKYPGDAARTRCFAHVLNLIVKSVISQFDLPKNRSSAFTDEDLDNEIKDLEAIAGDIAGEEEEEHVHNRRADLEEDDHEGWVNERHIMTMMEVDILERDMLPGRCVLTKVSPCLF